MTYSPLKGISGIFDSTLNNDIQDGLVEYFDWALLEKGNYFNVTANETSSNGEDMCGIQVALYQVEFRSTCSGFVLICRACLRVALSGFRINPNSALLFIFIEWFLAIQFLYFTLNGF